MSSFEGPVVELKGVSVDRFDLKNLESSVYFLTHYHSDHIIGLCKEFFKGLIPRTKQQRQKYLYCTQITKLFLQSRCKLPDELMFTVKELTPGSPTIVEYLHDDKNYSIVVTCVPAGHCPGSVMYIFETNNIRILYTGDFRIAPEDFPKLKALNMYNDGKVTPLKFNKIYLDTTFLNPEYSYFPTRKESMEETCRLVIDWLDDPNHKVYIQCPAYYSIEYIIIELWERLGERVHVTEGRFEDFSRIGELSMAVTKEPSNCRIHACIVTGANEKSPCLVDCDESYALTINLTAAFWKNCSPRNISKIDKSNNRLVRVCISMHPSYSEIKAFLKYFNFPEFHACVNPPIGGRNRKVLTKDQLTKLILGKNQEESALLHVEESVDFDLRSLIGSRTERWKSSFFSDDSSD